MTTNTFDRHTAKFLSSIAQAMPELSRDEMQKLIESPKKLNKILADAFKGIKSEEFSILENFVNSPDLWVNGNFTRLIAEPLGSVPVRPLSDLKFAKVLPRNMKNSEICCELLGGKETARANAVCPSQIFELIKQQSDGATGKLITTGYANIFYVIGKDRFLFPVRVGWSVQNSRWSVRCYLFERGSVWFQGVQVFSN